MPTPIHQQIMDAVKARLVTIDGTGSYNTDLSASIYEWSPVLEFSTLPAAVYRDTSQSLGEEISAHRHTLSVEVTLITASASATLVNLRKIIADVYRAVGVDQQWGGLAILTDWGGFSINYDEDDRMIGSALVSFSINYRTQEFNPDA